MNRRVFIRSTGILASGLLVAPAMPAFGQDRASGSLRLVIDRPDLAYAPVDAFLQGIGAGRGVVVRAHQLGGVHVGELVLTSGGVLRDYREEDSAEAEVLRKVARQLALPRPVDNPTMLTFSFGGHTRAGSGLATVLVDGTVAGRLDLHQDRPSLRIDGVEGHCVLSVCGGRVQVVDASCRHRTCMKMGDAGAPGEELLCIPSRIRVVVDGRNLGSVDAISH